MNVLDFIGNYRKANLIPFLLSGNWKDIQNKNLENSIPREEEYPEDCMVDFARKEYKVL